MCVCVHREIEYLKKETAQRRAQEESEATHKEETDNLQEKVKTKRKTFFNSFFFHFDPFMFIFSPVKRLRHSHSLNSFM